MEYYECPVVAKLQKKSTPLISTVPVDDFTKMVEANFDYEFTGESKFYPYKLPSELGGGHGLPNPCNHWCKW